LAREFDGLGPVLRLGDDDERTMLFERNANEGPQALDVVGVHHSEAFCQHTGLVWI
jgi:hypothetical protein